METYLGRDAGQRVLGGRILRGFADRIGAVIWFSDLRGFTRISDTTPEEVIPLLNDYGEVIDIGVHQDGGDVLKLIGDGTLTIFVASDDDPPSARNAAIAAAVAARTRRRAAQRTRAWRRGRAGDRHLSRPAYRPGVLRQYRQHRAAGFHGGGSSGQRDEPDRRDVPVRRSANPAVKKRLRASAASASFWPASRAEARLAGMAWACRELTALGLGFAWN